MCIQKALRKKHQLTYISRKTYGHCSVDHKSKHDFIALLYKLSLSQTQTQEPPKF